MKPHPYNIINAMRLVGYEMSDLLPGYPGRDLSYVEALMIETAGILNRPLLSYGLLGVHRVSGQFLNVISHDGRGNGSGEDVWPPRRDAVNVFCFGGSTTLGVGLEDRETIPACLERRLRAQGLPVRVYNFGYGNHTSRHEFLRLLDLIDRGTLPDAVVFLDGYNDSVYAFGNDDLIHALDDLYQAEKRRRRMSLLRATWDFIAHFRTASARLPSSQHFAVELNAGVETLLAEDAIDRALESSDGQSPLSSLSPTELQVAHAAWERYSTSVALVEALCGRYGINTTYFWQPVPFFCTRPDQRILGKLYHVFRHGVFSSPVYHWTSANGFPRLPSGVSFYDLSTIGSDLDGVLYLDQCHYTARLCEALAEAMANRLFISLREIANRKCLPLAPAAA